MMRLLRFLKRLFRRRPVIVSTFRVEKHDWLKLRYQLHRQLAEELGRTWPAKEQG